jgi:hypothetical protein
MNTFLARPTEWLCIVYPAFIRRLVRSDRHFRNQDDWPVEAAPSGQYQVGQFQSGAPEASMRLGA